MSYHIGFFMDQIAGHVTFGHNLRAITQRDLEITASWCDLFFYKEGGAIEKVRERLLPFVPTYFSGILRATVDMRRGLRASSYDAIFTNSTVAVFFSSSLRRVPTIIDLDSTPIQLDQMEAYAPQQDIKPVRALKYHLFKSMVHSAALLHCWSNWAKRSLVQDYAVEERKVVVNPPGVNLNYWHPKPTEPAPEGRRALRILFVGGDFRRKGGELLLEWYRSQDPARCELHVVTREPVEARPGLFVYHNMEPNSQELLRLYQQSDLFVLPSLAECFGIATVEAMAAGLPVIASDVGGTADIIEVGRNGYIVPAGSIGDLGAAIEAILEDPERRRRMAAQSRRMAEERFDLEVNAQRTLAYLKQAARMPSPRQWGADMRRSA